MPTREERIGKWHLRVDRDSSDRLTRATCGAASLEVDWLRQRGVFKSSDGGEVWEAGRARGEYLDLPYGHEVEVNDQLTLDAWVARRLFELRSQAFFEGGSASEARALFDLARRERTFDRSVTNPGARAWARTFAAIASDQELEQLVWLLDDAHGRQYLSYARTGAGKSRAKYFQHLAIPDDDDEARAVKKGHALLGLKKKESALELNRSLNNAASPLIDSDDHDDEVSALLAATGALVLSRTPSEESFGSQRANAAGEFHWRVNECRVAFKKRAFEGAVHHARRARQMELLLHELTERGEAPSEFTSSSGSWAFSSILCEVGLEQDARLAFGEFFADADRLKRRGKDGAGLQAAFIAGFYATWKVPLAQRGAWAEWFRLAREAVPEITWPLWAAWTADLWMTLDEVEEARSALRVAQNLGHDVKRQTADPDWADFVLRHHLEKSRSWRALLPSPPRRRGRR